ncbi:cyclodeaminase/cyclohydrolase family protein [Lachnoanaerobaculum sp. OBRC5-5]|uniref:cyclodeaminase/cyclohydrolase family protein n=1 Tax=Lachnoanaerobaculum sp. OBRC5-5 TaxID=936595 RepID=UPI0005537974|nr:cyclodeaminase/cyclohydrolase family protein [Lachnoanaerobaculum sp. OBRC5-5]
MVIVNTAGYNIDEYIKELGSKAPVPGGGGASAVAGALSAALSSMVCNLTVGKKSYISVEDDIKKILENMNKHMESFIKLSDKDAEVFYPLSQAYSFKPQNDEEKKMHEENMEKLLFDAAMVPLYIMKEAYSMLVAVDFLAKKGSKLAVSDAGVAVSMLRSAVCGAMMNVVINVKYMKNREKAQDLMDEASEILENTMNKADIIYRKVLEVLL